MQAMKLMIPCSCRQGDLSANALQQRFALALDTEAQGMFLELAELLPSPEQRSQLLQAAQQAGWTGDEGTKSPGAQDDSPLKACPIYLAYSVL